jgi:hypothetical protein
MELRGPRRPAGRPGPRRLTLIWGYQVGNEQVDEGGQVDQQGDSVRGSPSESLGQGTRNPNIHTPYGQLRVGPGREGPAYPQVEFVFAQPPWTNAALSTSITCSRSA